MLTVSTVGRPPAPRASSLCSKHRDNSFVLFGGVGPTSYFNDLFVFDFANASWNEIRPRTAPPKSRGGACGGIIEGRAMFVFGGRGDDGLLADSTLFDFETLEWAGVATSGDSPSPREDAAYCVLDTGIAVIGGATEHGACSEIWVLNFRRSSWTQALQSGTVPIDGIAAAGATQVGSDIFFFGGYEKSGRLRSDLLTLDLLNFRWSTVDIAGGVPRCRTHPVLVSLNDGLCVLGGYGSELALSDAWVLRVSCDRSQCIAEEQTAVIPLSLIAGRGAASAVMSGSRLLVFGGCTGERFLNTMFAIEVPEMLSKTLMLQNAKPLSAVKSSPRLDSVEGELDSALSGLRKEVLGSSAGTVGSIVDENMRLRKENEMLREAVASLTQRLAMLATVDREYL